MSQFKRILSYQTSTYYESHHDEGPMIVDRVIGKTLLTIPTSIKSTDLGGCPIDCPFFRFREQTMKMGLSDASGQGLQSAIRIRRQSIFFGENYGHLKS